MNSGANFKVVKSMQKIFVNLFQVKAADRGFAITIEASTGAYNAAGIKERFPFAWTVSKKH